MQNLKLNFQDAHNFDYRQIKGDAFQKLKELKSENSKFDLVILDPPAFARRKTHRSQALGSYSRLAELGVQLVAHGGRLFAASCSAPVSADDFYKAVHKGISFANKKLTETSRAGHAMDHPVLFSEMEYLKMVTGWVENK